MRIVQLIDSLEAGGAERMAVNYANALRSKIEFSGLITTRAEGPLLSSIDKQVCYSFLNKHSKFDLAAIRKLVRYCKVNKVNVIHAHSTSILLAVLAKVITPSIKIVWHDHYGNSEFLDQRDSKEIRFLLRFCNAAIAVNSKLEHFINHKLNFPKTIYLPNFASIDMQQISVTKLHGLDGKRIVCLANLREQKNHLLLLEVAEKLKPTFPDWTFHFVGKDFDDQVSKEIKKAIIDKNLELNVFLYGSCTDTIAILEQSEIAVLSSKSEGLPVALLEYGLCSKAVIATAVGEIPSIIKDGENGYLVDAVDANAFYFRLENLISGADRDRFGKNLKRDIVENFGQENIVNRYLEWLRRI